MCSERYINLISNCGARRRILPNTVKKPNTSLPPEEKEPETEKSVEIISLLEDTISEVNIYSPVSLDDSSQDCFVYVDTTPTNENSDMGTTVSRTVTKKKGKKRKKSLVSEIENIPQASHLSNSSQPNKQLLSGRKNARKKQKKKTPSKAETHKEDNEVHNEDAVNAPVINLDTEDESSIVILSDEELAATGLQKKGGKKNRKKKMGQHLNTQKVGSCSGIINGNFFKTSVTLPQTQPAQPKPPVRLRPIVIDGSNVAFGHGRTQAKFSSRGILICVNHFKNLGHKVTAFIPQFRRRHPATLEPEILECLEKEGTVVFTPSRCVEGRMVIPYDDRYIVEYAHQVEGVIVSRDNYRDLLNEDQKWAETINKRLLMFTWVNGTLMFPQDPLGRGGPTLQQFLSFDK